MRIISSPFHVEPYRKDNNGTLYYEVDLERTTEVVEKFYDLIFGEGGYLMPRKYEDYSARVLNMVSEGRSMFFYGSLDHAVYTFSDTDFVFGVLPMPKLDASEEGYYGGSFDRPFVVPTTAQNLENIGIMRNRKYVHFVPMNMDDPAGKPHSLVADFGKIPQEIEKIQKKYGL